MACPFCPVAAPCAGRRRHFDSDEDLHRHLESRYVHPSILVSMFPTESMYASHANQLAASIDTRYERCPLCPKKKTVLYDRQSMIKHVSKRSVLFPRLQLGFLNPDERLAIESKAQAGRGRFRATLSLIFLSPSVSFFSYSATPQEHATPWWKSSARRVVVSLWVLGWIFFRSLWMEVPSLVVYADLDLSALLLFSFVLGSSTYIYLHLLL